MRPYVVELLNESFDTRLFTYLVPNYLVMLSLGMLAGTLWAVERARKLGLDPDAVYGLAFWGFPAALAGGRFLHWLYAPQVYQGSLLTLLDPLWGASVAYGGFMACTAAAVLYLLWRRLDVWRYLDCAVPAVGLGTCITRLGCLLDGDDFGSVTTSVLAVRFPAGSPAFQAQVERGLLSLPAYHSLPVHPVQLYLAANGLLLAALTAWWSRRQQAAAGEALCLYWILYAAARFGLEFLRGDVSRGFIGPFSTSQVISIPVAVLAGVTLWQRVRHRSGRH